VAKKKVVRKALPTVWNLEQLDDELRAALGATQRYGIIRIGDAPPQIVAPRRERTLRARKGQPKTVILEDVPWTDAQFATIQATLEAHVADPLWGEKADERIIRLALSNAGFDAYRAKANADITLLDTARVTKDLIQIVRAMAKRIRNEAT
jgi:hypothetical protein